MPRQILFIHAAFPGRFAPLLALLAAEEGAAVTALGGPQARACAGVDPVRWAADAVADGSEAPSAGQTFERQMACGRAAAAAAHQLMARGYSPELVIGHGGCGEMAFMRDVFPQARLVLVLDQCEALADECLESRQNHRAGQGALFLQCAEADRIVTPLRHLGAQLPKGLRSRLLTIRDGVDCASVQADRAAALPAELAAVPETALMVSFSAPQLDEGCHYPAFSEALARVQGAHPQVHGIAMALEGLEPREPAERVRWRAIVARAALHVHLHREGAYDPMLYEAMALGTPILALDTAASREILTPGETALLCASARPDSLAAELSGALQDRERLRALGHAARLAAENRFSRAAVHDGPWLKLVRGLLGAPAQQSPTPSPPLALAEVHA